MNVSLCNIPEQLLNCVNVRRGPDGIPIVNIDWDAGIFASLQPSETRGNWHRTTMVIDGIEREVLEHVYNR